MIFNTDIRVVLSLLAFEKQPLKLAEVGEAIGIMKTQDGEDMPRVRECPKDIVRSCLPLIRHDPITDIIIFSHSAIVECLFDDTAPKEEYLARLWPVVDPRIVRTVCLRYLKQPKYEEPLVRRTDDSYGVRNSQGWVDEVASHSLLVYAAKYCFRHFDAREESRAALLEQDEIDGITQFVQSANFLTCIQLQSLFITGYFLQSFDPITDNSTRVRRTLPSCLSSDVLDQFLAFQGEWDSLLQAWPPHPLRGDLDRCLWKALGPDNFLSSNACQHKSSLVSLNKGTAEDTRCQFHHTSEDGQFLFTAWVTTQG